MKSLCFALLGLLLSVPVVAQTTGVPFTNDLEISLPPLYIPQGSGVTSCTAPSNMGFIPGAPFVVAYQSTSVSSTAAILLLDFFTPCQSPGFPFTPTATVACAGPIAGGTNLWYALGFSPFPVTVLGITNTTGRTRWNFNVPVGPGQCWAQVLFLDLCSPATFKFSQALGFNW